MKCRWLAVGSACVVLILAAESRADFVSLAKSGGLARTITANTSPSGPPFLVSYGPSSGVVSYNPRTGGSQSELDKFDLSSLAGSRILSATLSFSVYLAIPTNATSVNLSVVGRGASSPSVTADDFSSNNAIVSSSTSILGSITSTTPFNLDQTAALQTLIDGGFSSIAYLFSVTNSGNVSFTGPVLNVTYQAGGGAVPEPSSLVLGLVGGLTGLAGWKLRRR